MSSQELSFLCLHPPQKVPLKVPADDHNKALGFPKHVYILQVPPWQLISSAQPWVVWRKRMLLSFSVAILLCSSQQIRMKGFLFPSSQIQTGISHLDISLSAVKIKQNKTPFPAEEETEGKYKNSQSHHKIELHFTQLIILNSFSHSYWVTILTKENQ